MRIMPKGIASEHTPLVEGATKVNTEGHKVSITLVREKRWPLKWKFIPWFVKYKLSIHVKRPGYDELFEEIDREENDYYSNCDSGSAYEISDKCDEEYNAINKKWTKLEKLSTTTEIKISKKQAQLFDYLVWEGWL